MKRVAVPELMDSATPDPSRLRESLSDLAWVNRYLGGTTIVAHQMRSLLRGYDRSELRVVDVGAGGGDMLAMLSSSRRLGVPRIAGIALDYGAETVHLARRTLARNGNDASIVVVRGDARSIPIEDRGVDVAICSTFLHHLSPDEVVGCLKEMARVSRWGIIAADLRRSRLGHTAVSLLANTLWSRHPYSRHDGPASMRAAYSVAEARALARAAGLDGKVAPQPGFRWALSWKRDTR